MARSSHSQAFVVLLLHLSSMSMIARAAAEHDGLNLVARQGQGQTLPITNPLSPAPTSTSSTSSSSSSTTSSPQPSLTSLSFIPITNLTSCVSQDISWHYSGPPATLNVSILSYSPIAADDVFVEVIQSRIIIGTIDAPNEITWPKVDVNPGTYLLQGYTQGSTFSSNPFGITAGSDTSCLTNYTPAPSSTPSSPVSAAPTNVSDSSSSSSSSALSGGDIAGIVVGSLVFACAVFAAFVLWRLFVRRKPSSSSVGGFREKRAWGGLNSVDYHGKGAGAQGGDGSAALHRTGTLPIATDFGAAAAVRRSSMASSDGKGSPAPSEEEGTTVAHMSMANEYPPSPSGATAQSPTSTFTRQTRSSDPQIAALGVKRSNSGANAQRRSSALRKPVPAYRGGEGVEAHKLRMDPMIRTASGRASGSQSSLTGSAAPSASHSQNPFVGGYELPELNHKSSFGDRPMHVLIPDLPPPQR